MLIFAITLKNKEYIYHLYDLFKEYCGSPPKHMSSFDARPNKMETYHSIKFQTLSLSCFNKYRNLFYREDGIKIIPINIEDLLTAKGLAYWFIDDGYKSTIGFYISTESYSYEDHLLIVKALNNKFKLRASIHKTTNGNRIYISSASVALFKELVGPHVVPHFYYKLEIN